jgi:hypothetical protein
MVQNMRDICACQRSLLALAQLVRIQKLKCYIFLSFQSYFMPYLLYTNDMIVMPLSMYNCHTVML